MKSADLQRSIVLSIAVIPLFASLVALPLVLTVGFVAISSSPWIAVAILAALCFGAWVVWQALAQPRWWMTSVFIALGASPFIFWFGVRPVLEERDFRDYRRIPADEEIVFYRQSYGRDSDRFALIQLPESKINKSSRYRPIPSGVTSTVDAIARSLNIPKDKLPDLSKSSIRYYGGENETAGDDRIWMFLSVIDVETRQQWIMEYGY